MFSLLVQPVKQIGQIVSIFHAEIGLPSAFNHSRRIGLRVPDSPAIFEQAHLVPHPTSVAMSQRERQS